MVEEALLDARITNSGYSGIRVIWDVSIEVHPGEVVLLLGSNGAGKTTFLKSMMGIIEAREGKVAFKGKDITKVPLRSKQSLGISYISEDTFFNNLTISENLRMGNLTLSSSEVRKRMEEVFTVFPELKDRLGNKCSSLSGGQRKMLIMARAIMGTPDLLVVDEPSGGLSPLFVDKVLDVISLLKKKGMSILISEQNVEFAYLADRIYVMDNGRITFNGTPEEALKDNAIHNAYFNI